MGGGEGTQWRRLMDERQARGPVDIDLTSQIVPAEAMPPGQNFPMDDVIEILASEGVGFRATPGGGGGGAILVNPTTVATIILVVEVVKALAGKFVEGFADAIGADVFERVKRASHRLRTHRAPEVSTAPQVLSLEFKEKGVDAGSVHAQLPSQMTAESLAALGEVSLPRFPEAAIFSYELQWDAKRRQWLLVLPKRSQP